MSKSLSNVTETTDDLSSLPEELLPDKRKLSWSQSENTLDSHKNVKHKSLEKVLSKVKSWSSSNDSEIKERNISVELDLVRSLTKLEVLESNEDLAGIHLLRARDSLDIMVKDEQNMPKSNLERSILQPKSRSMPDSPKSSPQLGGNCKAGSTKMIYWDRHDRQDKKNRKDNKRNNKDKNTDSLRSDGSGSISSKNHSTLKNETSDETTEKVYSLEAEEDSPQYQFLAKNSKSVEFTNEAMVIYFNNDNVVGERKEPLKKEVDQQTRNKEMRRIHLNKTQEKCNLCLF
ncbi:uncharacterized protein [Euwallacea fornicatus]|uniref:uncharacterized protein n=1 Tax=Euwallacea fornicatus TaxID=995702 RepID=UPI00339061CB